MGENELLALVRATIMAELPGVDVRQMQNPVTVGVPSPPTIFMQTIIPARRVGWVGRRDIVRMPDANMVHQEIQWLETTLQISALARRDPADPTYLNQPSAADLCRSAADILQGDRGLAQLAGGRVRPLRVTEVRTVYFVNDSDQYEANPSFDVVLIHVQIREGETAPVSEFSGQAGRV